MSAKRTAAFYVVIVAWSHRDGSLGHEWPEDFSDKLSNKPDDRPTGFGLLQAAFSIPDCKVA